MTSEYGEYANGNIFLATQPAMKDFCDKIDEAGGQIAEAYSNVSEFLYIW